MFAAGTAERIALLPSSVFICKLLGASPDESFCPLMFTCTTSHLERSMQHIVTWVNVTIDGDWIGNRIYWTLRHNSWLQFTNHCHTHTDQWSQSRLPTADVSVLPGSLPRWLAAISHQPPTHLTAAPELSRIQSQSYIATDGRSISKSWRRAIYYCLTVTVLFLWGALSDERTGRSFVYAAGPRQRSLSRVRVPWISRPYFAVSVLRLPFSSPPTTRRVTVEVFDPASTRVYLVLPTGPFYIASAWTAQKTPLPTVNSIVACYIAMAFSLAPQFLLWANMPQYFFFSRNFSAPRSRARFTTMWTSLFSFA
jgi:hypothetical protein